MPSGNSHSDELDSVSDNHHCHELLPPGPAIKGSEYNQNDSLRGCSSLCLVSVIKHQPKATLGGMGFIWLINPYHKRSHRRSSSRALTAGTEAELERVLLIGLLSWSATCLYLPGPPAQGVALPTVGWTFSHQSLTRECPRLAYQIRAIPP